MKKDENACEGKWKPINHVRIAVAKEEEKKEKKIKSIFNSHQLMRSKVNFFSDSVCVRSRIPNNTTDYLRQSDEKLENKRKENFSCFLNFLGIFNRQKNVDGVIEI